MASLSPLQSPHGAAPSAASSAVAAAVATADASALQDALGAARHELESLRRALASAVDRADAAQARADATAADADRRVKEAEHKCATLATIPGSRLTGTSETPPSVALSRHAAATFDAEASSAAAAAAELRKEIKSLQAQLARQLSEHVAALTAAQCKAEDAAKRAARAESEAAVAVKDALGRLARAGAHSAALVLASQTAAASAPPLTLARPSTAAACLVAESPSSLMETPVRSDARTPASDVGGAAGSLSFTQNLGAVRRLGGEHSERIATELPESALTVSRDAKDYFMPARDIRAAEHLLQAISNEGIRAAAVGLVHAVRDARSRLAADFRATVDALATEVVGDSPQLLPLDSGADNVVQSALEQREGLVSGAQPVDAVGGSGTVVPSTSWLALTGTASAVVGSLALAGATIAVVMQGRRS